MAPPSDSQPARPTPSFPLSLPWQRLLETLHTHGFVVSPAHTLRLEALLRRLPPDTPIERIKYLIAPLFVTSESQQEKFYRLYNDFLASYPVSGPVGPEIDKENDAPGELWRRFKWITLVVLLVLTICMGTPCFDPSIPLGTNTVRNEDPVQYFDVMSIDPYRNLFDPRITEMLLNGGYHPFSPPPKFDSQFSIEIKPVKVKQRKVDRTLILPVGKTSFPWEQYGWRKLFLFVPFVLIWLVAVMRRISVWLATVLRRSIVPKRRTPPFRWPILVEPPERSIHDIAELQETARRMRTRQVTEGTPLDIGRSIESTIREGGFPTLVYRPTTRRPEYLVLIDRRSALDHLAAFYAELVQTFQREGIRAEFLFFDDDIRLCRRSESDDSIELSLLTTKFATSHRLLIIADGNRLINPVTGLRPEWTSVFFRWKERALFLSEPLPPRTVEELERSGLFPLFPADFTGLDDFLQRLTGERQDTVDHDFQSLDSAVPTIPDTFSTERLKALKKFLGEDAFLWLRVCALYPDLDWNLTLRLGTLPSLPAETRSRENVLRLAHLDWFRTGKIPETWRWELMSRLPEPIAGEAREVIADLMEQDSPPANSYAREAFRLELALQRWAAHPTPKNRQHLGEILSEMRQEDILKRLVLVKLLQNRGPRSIWSRALWRVEKMAYERGIRELGFRMAAQIILALLISFMACLALLLTPAAPSDGTSDPFIISNVRNLTVESSTVEFDSGGLGFRTYTKDESTTGHLVFKNELGQSVTVQIIHPEKLDRAFALQSTLRNQFQVPNGKSYDFSIQFTPHSNSMAEAQLQFSISGSRTEYALPLSGIVDSRPPLSFEPPQGLTFNTNEIDRPKSLKINNHTGGRAHVTIALDPPTDFSIKQKSQQEQYIPANGAVDISFTYHPSDTKAHSALATIKLIEPSVRPPFQKQIPLRGSAADEHPFTSHLIPPPPPYQPEVRCDVLIVGGGTGGTAAALAAAKGGANVYLLESSDWLGGQLTAQGYCKPLENQYVETVGSTASYRTFRNAVRNYYRTNLHLSARGATQPVLNPGGDYPGFSMEPGVGHNILAQQIMALPNIHVQLKTSVTAVEVKGSEIASVTAVTPSGKQTRYVASFVLDATDLGDVLLRCGRQGADWVVGAESQAETGEPNAPAVAHPDWIRPITVPFALERRPADENHTITKPQDYDRLKVEQRYSIAEGYITSMFGSPTDMWSYGQFIASANFADAFPFDLGMINMGSNEYQGATIPTGNPAQDAAIVARARQASLGYLYWLQTECPRDDHSGFGYPQLKLHVDVINTPDGMAAAPYIREGRRIKALKTIVEQDIVGIQPASISPNSALRANLIGDSCGISHDPIIIHALASVGMPELFEPTKFYQIPVRALIPRRLSNLLAASKDIGTTHVTAYRTAPSEWGIGEAAGTLAVFCIELKLPPREVTLSRRLVLAYQHRLLAAGVPLFWWTDVAVDDSHFAAIQLMGVSGLMKGDPGLSFRPDAVLTAKERQSITLAAGLNLSWPSGLITRGQAAVWLAQQLKL